MQRRDFIKYFSIFCALGCAGCGGDYSKQPAHETLYWNSKKFPQDNIVNNGLNTVKFPLCYHCNSNCAYCSHFAPLAPKYEMPPEVFEKDLKKLYELTQGRVKHFELLGGEPLLNKKIEEIVGLLGQYFPNSSKNILSNGIILNYMPKSFFEILEKTDTHLMISRYPAFEKLFEDRKYLEITDKYQSVVHFFEEKRDNFQTVGLLKSYQTKDEVNHKICQKRPISTQLDNGKLYICPIMANIKIFNNYFPKHAIELAQDEVLDIHKINSFDEVINFYRKPKNFCKHCHYGHNQTVKEWKLSKKELKEWYGV